MTATVSTQTLREPADSAAPPVAGWDLPDTLLENLQLIVDGVTAVAGFGVAAIRVRRGNDLELIVDTGHPDSVGSRVPLQLMVDELALADVWGQLLFVPHERTSGAREADGWVVVTGGPVIDAPDAWHPEDMLVAPLYDGFGELSGVLAFDEPLDGRRPGPAQRQVLERFAKLAARAVLSALEREALAQQVAMATTVKSIVRTSSAQLSLGGLLAASEATLREGFGATYAWIKTVATDEHSGAEHVPGTVVESLPEDLVEFAELSAHYCWQQQEVMTLGRAYDAPQHMRPDHYEHVLRLLDAMGMSSLVFAPLGAGTECMGSLVLVREGAGREWTSVECAALIDIGHDLGRAALNARTFEREHALVAELQALDTYKSQLIATVSHELKSPLTTVAGHLEMLESGEVDISDQARDSLTAIGRASSRMSRVIEDLLLLRKVGESARPVRHDPVDLVTLVNEALALTSMAVGAKELDVHLLTPAGPVVALGEHDDLDKVVLNLVSNAVKYTEAGGRVDISLSTYDALVELAVRDTGIGISEDDQRQLFTEFFRSSNPQAVAQPGTGLGLTIVQRIVERHGGSIEVASSLGGGSTFTITLPAA